MSRGHQPAPVLPDYAGGSLAGVMPALMAPPGSRPGWVPSPAAGADQVVLLVLDGLGWLQLDARRHLAPTLAAMTGSSITSVAPTTTATALASIALGRTPAEHGMVGYRLAVEGPSGPEVMNVLRWRTPSGDARGFVVPEEFQTEPAFRGHPVPVVSRVDFGGSGFSVAHLHGSRLAGWGVPSSIAVEVRRQLAAGERFVYAYYEGVDKVAHLRGFGEEYDAELVAVDRIVADLLSVLPAGAALVVTADHGQVQVGDAVTPLDPAVLEMAALVSGEARFAWLHAAPGGADDLLQAAEERYGHEAWVRSTDEVEAEGWLGSPLDDRVRRRLGDVAIVPWGPIAYREPADHAVQLACRHGSLTAEEMLVPLVAAGGR